MRVLIKILLVVLLATAAVLYGWRLVAGRYPPPAAAFVSIAALVALIVALDAGIGW